LTPSGNAMAVKRMEAAPRSGNWRERRFVASFTVDVEVEVEVEVFTMQGLASKRCNVVGLFKPNKDGVATPNLPHA